MFSLCASAEYTRCKVWLSGILSSTTFRSCNNYARLFAIQPRLRDSLKLPRFILTWEVLTGHLMLKTLVRRERQKLKSSEKTFKRQWTPLFRVTLGTFELKR